MRAVTPELESAIEGMLEWLDYVATDPEQIMVDVKALRSAWVDILVNETRQRHE